MTDERPLKKRVKYSIIYWFVRALIFISNAIPRGLWLAFCGWLGTVAYAFASQSKERTLYHLGLAFGREKGMKEVMQLSKETYTMLGKNAGDILRASRVRTLNELNKFLVTHDFENFEKAQAKGKGVIFLTCHVGAFDLQITNMALRGLNPLIIGTVLKDPRLNQLLWEHRNAHGAVAIERGKETIRLIKNLKSGGSLAILIDQDTKVKSRFVDFFGMAAATPVGAAIFAMKTGAIVVPTYIYLGDDNKQHMHFLPEIPLVLTGDDEKDMVTNTTNYTRFIEDVIRQHPAQWVWMHERWKTRPGEEIV
jgi:Kdo2-lipid IVA lauroyltransferase/acyltransferase